MDPGPTISRPYTRHKWVGRMICSQANVSALAQDLLRLPESMTIIKNRTDTLRFSFPLMIMVQAVLFGGLFGPGGSDSSNTPLASCSHYNIDGIGAKISVVDDIA
jgi:hypothetical protein